MGTIFTQAAARALVHSLDSISTDPDTGAGEAVYKQYMDVETMDNAYEDEQEYAFDGLPVEEGEGAELTIGTLYEGTTTRYIARKFRKGINVSEEALEDLKDKQIIKAGKRLVRAMHKLVDFDAANVLNRMFNASYVGGDDVCLGNASHTLPGGGSFSNLMGTPLSPSRVALITATTLIGQLPGYDGTALESFMPRQVICPWNQWATWEGIIKSDKVPESNYNEVNVMKRFDLEVVAVKGWTASTTNWAVRTDADDGLKFKWRVRPTTKSWVDNSLDVMRYGIRARWARGWTNARGILCVNA